MSLIVTPHQLHQRADLYHQLAQLTAAGIGLPQAVEMQQRHPPSASFRQPLAQVVRRLNDGATFSEALQSLGRWLPVFDIALLKAGEQSGRLPHCFHLLATYYRDRAQLVRSLLSLLAYPAFIFHFAFLIFPITRFQKLFLEGDLVGYVLQKLAFFAPFYAVVLLLVFAMQGRHGEPWRALVERWLRLVPVLGTARRSLALARLSAALEALIAAGVPIIEAWDLAAQASGSPALRRRVQEATPRLYAGETPAEMVNRSADFPPEFASLYHTGEVTGQLEESLQRLNGYFQEEGSRKLRTFMKGAGGAFILLVMLLIAYQIISFWLGYFQQIQQVIPP